jgi:chromate transporter
MAPDPRPTHRQLFLGFMSAGVRGFGGVFVMGRRMLVEERQWLTAEEFVELLGLCQFLPGANIVNLSVVVGRRFRGWTGSLAALAGIVVAPAVIAAVLAALFLRYAALPQVGHAVAVMAAAAGGLVIGTAIKMAAPVVRKDGVLAVPIVAGTLVLAAGLHWPLIAVLAVMAPLGMGLAWMRRGRARGEG